MGKGELVEESEMNPEPLKNKGINETKEELPEFKSFAGAMANAGRRTEQSTGKVMYYEEDIKSAVEWLEQEVIKTAREHKGTERISPQRCLKLIKIAFEDVKNDKRNENRRRKNESNTIK